MAKTNFALLSKIGNENCRQEKSMFNKNIGSGYGED
jgi:hypothetical protein